MPFEVIPLLLVGFGFGLIHALDADHIMAVSVLNQHKPGFRRTIWHSSHWACGHAGVLMVSGALLFGLGVAIPESLQKAAEMSVGILLIFLGLMCFGQIRKEKLKLESHRHGDIVHTHWHGSSEEHVRVNTHKPVFVGMLHGLAGSAPALALIPAMANGQPLQAMSYLALFSLGVMLAMLFFGLSFAHIQRLLSQRYQTVFQMSRHVMAFSSIAFGGYWLFQAA